MYAWKFSTVFTVSRRKLRTKMGYWVLITKRFDRECSPRLPVSRGFHLPSMSCINIQSKGLFISARVLLRDLNTGESLAGCGLCTEVQ